ncbi:MAG: heme ABC exporter ATP-binding protein CcmA [Pseudomonadota bacterium]
MALQIENVTCRRGGRLVLSDLSCQVADGEALVIRGPNGVGKSTLLRCLAGMIPIERGSVNLGDISLADRGLMQEQIVYSGHLDAVKPSLTVRQNLDFWAKILGDGGRVDAALAYFQLDGISPRPAAQCSAGQKRRLALARLMVVQRKLWLLDEPTVSLDAASSALVAAMIRDHCAGGGIALVATHIDLDLGEAAVLQMVPPTQTDPQEDAFLTGAWT